MPWSADICAAAVTQDRAGSCFLSVTAEEVELGSSTLFAVVQESLGWLREFGYGATEERGLIQLWTLQQLAVEAVVAVCPGPRRAAKRLQMKAAPQEALTVCVGELTPKRLPDLRNVLDPQSEFDEDTIPTIAWNTRGSGCMAICADSTGVRRPDFRQWCAECASKTTWRERARIAHIKGNWRGPDVSHSAWRDGHRIQVWPRTCSSCGKPFRSAEGQRRRCYDCWPGRESPALTSLG